MSETITREDGTEVTLYTEEEVSAKAKEAADATAAEKDAEITRLAKVSAEKTENFRRYNEMTEEEKKAYDANTVSLMKRGDQLEDDLKKEREIREAREVADRDRTKNTALKGFHAGSEDAKKTIEEKYALLSGMPEGTPEEIQARATEAAKLAGISVDSRNPLYVSIHGEAPQYKANKEYVETPEGKEDLAAVRAAMGLPEAK